MTPASKGMSPSQLVRLLAEQRDEYRKLLALGVQQRSLITGDRPELLLSVLTQRHECVMRLQALSREIAPLREDWNAVQATLPEDVRRETAALVEEIAQAARTMLERDQEDGALLAMRKQAVADELAQIGGARSANAAYGRQSMGGAPTRGTDLSG